MTKIVIIIFSPPQTKIKDFWRIKNTPKVSFRIFADIARFLTNMLTISIKLLPFVNIHLYITLVKYTKFISWCQQLYYF